MVKNGKSGVIEKCMENQINFDTVSLSLILTQMKKNGRTVEAEYFLKQLEKVQLGEIRSICTCVALGKFFKYSQVAIKRMMEKLVKEKEKLSCRDIAEIMSGLKHLEIPLSEQIEIVECFSENIIGKAKEFKAIDRSWILQAISRYLSEKVLITAKALLDCTDQSSIFELSAACNYLSQYPNPGSMGLFKTTENFILDHKPPLEKVFTQLVHSFSKVHMGSEELFEYFSSKLFLFHSKIDSESLGVVYLSLIKSGKISQKTLQILESSLQNDRAKLNQKHLNTIEFFSSQSKL